MSLFVSIITWGALPYALYLAPVVVLLVLLLVKHLFWQKKIALYLASPHHAYRLLSYFSLGRRTIQVFLIVVSLVSIVLAIARPMWDMHHEKIEQEGRDVLIALDISRSMLAQDVKPNRLELAKNKIKKLITTLNSERVGLLVFSGAPFVQCPITSDIGACLTFLDAVNVETISSGTTALDQAINKALDTFSNMPTKKNKLLVIFTDGEDFSSNLENVRQRAQQMGLKIFTVGTGSVEGAPIPLVDEEGKIVGHQQDEHGNIVISRLNEKVLSSLAHTSGARYVRATEDDSDIEHIARTVKQFEKEKFDDKQVNKLQERYYYFALVSLLCLVLEWIL